MVTYSNHTTINAIFSNIIAILGSYALSLIMHVTVAMYGYDALYVVYCITSPHCMAIYGITTSDHVTYIVCVLQHNSYVCGFCDSRSYLIGL